ncbi:MAG: hypothetical protein HYS27_03425 [Deltaproteobacteria bacterium]|nr:hypothetical protein [Deltaproteobacteria bacterium]
MTAADKAPARDITRIVLVVAVCGGLLLVVGAALRLVGDADRGLLSLGAAVFLATPLARNAAVLARERRRPLLLLALVGAAALLAVYGWAAWRLLGAA